MTGAPMDSDALRKADAPIPLDRPLWSVMIPTYRPGAHLREALLGAKASLEACGARAQLEVVDDASPGVDVEALIRSWGIAGVAVFRRPANGGLGECWNTCIERAGGELVHILHQDDLVKPAFYQRMQQAARACPSAGMIFCRTEFLESSGTRLDELEQAGEGLIPNWLERISAGQRLQCPSVVMRRATYRRVGHYDPRLRYIIDWEMWIRVAASSDVAYVPEALAVYRIHDAAETRKIKAAGAVTRDLANGLQRISDTLIRAGRTDCLPLAKTYAVRVSSHAAYDAEQAGNRGAAAGEISGFGAVPGSLGQSGAVARAASLVWPCSVRGVETPSG